MSIFPLSIRKGQESLNLDFSDNHESLYSLNVFSKISFVDTFNSESCMVPARAEWQITCYRKRPFPSAVQCLLCRWWISFSFYQQFFSFVSTQDCDPLSSCMSQSSVGTLIGLRGFQKCPSEREQGFRNEQWLRSLAAY